MNCKYRKKIYLPKQQILPNQNIPMCSVTQFFQFIKVLKESYVHLPQYPTVRMPIPSCKNSFILEIMKIKTLKLPGIYLLSYVIFSKISGHIEMSIALSQSSR